MRSCVKLAVCNVLRRTRETYHRVPGTGAEAERVVANTETAYSVVVALQCAYALTAQYIPYLRVCQRVDFKV
jgi:hypothetical protein